MVMTILEAQVTLENAPALKEAFADAVKTLEPGLVQTFLAQSSSEPGLWRIMTVWQDRAALNRMRQSGETPRGVQIFRQARAEPTLTIFDIVDSGNS